MLEPPLDDDDVPDDDDDAPGVETTPDETIPLGSSPASTTSIISLSAASSVNTYDICPIQPVVEGTMPE